MAKRANREGTFRKRADGRWEARYYNPSDNKQHSIYGKTQKEVREKMYKKLQEIDELDDLDGENMSVAQWLDIWLKNYTGNIKPSTFDTYLGIIEFRIKPFMGDVILQKLTTNNVQDFYMDMKSDGLTPKTIKNAHGIIHKALNQAIKLNYLKNNVSDGCVIPKQERKEIQVMEEKDVALFLKAIKGDIYEDVFFVTLFTGMRQGEVLGLSWKNIDFENGTIYLNKQLLKSRGGQGCAFGSLKNGKSRTIYMPHSVAEVLKHRKIKQQHEKISGGKSWITNNKPWQGLVFTDEHGDCLKHHNVYRHFKKIVKDMGLEKLRFHDLRHSFASLSLKNGDDIKTVQEALGHYTASFTLQVYAHATNSMRKDSANRMDLYIQNLAI